MIRLTVVLQVGILLAFGFLAWSLWQTAQSLKQRLDTLATKQDLEALRQRLLQ